MAITEERPTAGECPRTTSLQRIHKRPAYSPGHSQLCVCRRPWCHYTEHGLCTDQGNTDLGSKRSVGVLYHKPVPRESHKDASQPLPPAESRMWQTAQHQLEQGELNPSAATSRCILAPHWNERCRIIKHISRRPKRKSEQETTSKWGATPTTLRSSTLALHYWAAEYACPGVGALHPCKETGCDTEWNLSNDHRLSEADKHQQSAHTRRNRPIRHQESGGKSYRKDSACYGPKAPTQWTSRSGATPEIAEELKIKCTEHINTTAKASRIELWRERLEPLDASVDPNISADEHLPAGAENPWTTWKALNRLYTQVGRSRVNMLKWGFSNEQETCDCGIRPTMQHLLVCPMMDTACSPQDLAMANGIAIGCAKHWEGTIWRTYDSWWKDKNDDD